MRLSDTIYYVDVANIAHSGLLLVINNNNFIIEKTWLKCSVVGNESQLEGNYCFALQYLGEQNKSISPSRFSFCVITKHINMADNSVGTPWYTLHENIISTGQFAKTLLSYNPVLLETEISFLSIRYIFQKILLNNYNDYDPLLHD